MPSRIKEEVTSFLNLVQQAGKQLKHFGLEVEGREQQIRNELQKLKQFLQQITSQSSVHTTTKVTEFETMTAEIIAMYGQKIEHWVQYVQQHMDGKQFIHLFEKSVLLIVFGNVNSGKSSLGNFIAGSVDELRTWYEERPSFYVYDMGVQSTAQREPVQIESGHFAEDCIEATSTIQYFTLGNGLTWVDTPGIHSINSYNEDLAKKYVDYADLVLCIIPSSAPGKADEITEINRLMKKQKPLLVTLTKSDTNLEDEVDGKIVSVLQAKSETDRLAQEQYVAKELQNRGLFEQVAGAQFVSLSTHLAKAAVNQQDEKLFADSGIPKFYKQIGQVLSQQALQLKTSRPKQQINSTIDELRLGFELKQEHVEGIQDMIHSFEEILSKIVAGKKQLQEVQQDIITEVTAKAQFRIDTAVRQLAFKFDEGQQISSSEISQLVQHQLLTTFNHVLSTKVKKILLDFQFEQAKMLHLNLDVKFESTYQEVERPFYEVVTVQRDPEGFIEHVASWFGKTYTTNKTVRQTDTVSVKVGSNASMVLANIHKKIEPAVIDLAHRTIQEIEQQYFCQTELIINRIIEQIKQIDRTFDTIRY